MPKRQSASDRSKARKAVVKKPAATKTKRKGYYTKEELKAQKTAASKKPSVKKAAVKKSTESKKYSHTAGKTKEGLKALLKKTTDSAQRAKIYKQLGWKQDSTTMGPNAGKKNTSSLPRVSGGGKKKAAPKRKPVASVSKVKSAGVKASKPKVKASKPVVKKTVNARAAKLRKKGEAAAKAGNQRKAMRLRKRYNRQAKK